eukprot:scaffold7390_cov420-Prasinococcus_capsulatus_cf.AAC.8
MASLNAQKAKLSSEILYQEQCITSALQKFGVAVYEPLVERREEYVKQLLAETKQQVDALRAKIAEKQAEIERINQRLQEV